MIITRKKPEAASLKTNCPVITVAKYPFQQVHIEKYKKAATFERSSYVAEVL